MLLQIFYLFQTWKHNQTLKSRSVPQPLTSLKLKWYQTSTLLYDLCNIAGFISGHDENILQAVQDDLHHLAVFHRQQVAERRDDALFHQELHLHIHTAAISGCSSPHHQQLCLISGFLFSLTWSFLPLMVRLLMAHAASF